MEKLRFLRFLKFLDEGVLEQPKNKPNYLVQIIQIESFEIRQGRSESNEEAQGQDHSHLKTLHKVSSGFQNQNFKEQTRPVARRVENY